LLGCFCFADFSAIKLTFCTCASSSAFMPVYWIKIKGVIQFGNSLTAAKLQYGCFIRCSFFKPFFYLATVSLRFLIAVLAQID
jgi:hypothetical protein